MPSCRSPVDRCIRETDQAEYFWCFKQRRSLNIPFQLPKTTTGVASLLNNFHRKSYNHLHVFSLVHWPSLPESQATCLSPQTLWHRNRFCYGKVVSSILGFPQLGGSLSPSADRIY